MGGFDAIHQSCAVCCIEWQKSHQTLIVSFLSIMEELQHNINEAELAADITNQFWQRNHVYRVDIRRFNNVYVV